MASKYDIAIVGGGLVGSSVAIALGASNFRVVLLDSQPLAEISFSANQ
ncbi:MAG: FAD-dependent oxidoreductase, partial [Gammaproteobacteria bacterium]